MTATLDRPDLAPAEPASPRRERRIPPGSEAMARPWRLSIAFAGATVGLLARLLIANGVGDVNGDALVLAAAATSALVAAGLLALTAERDRFGWSMLSLALACGLALGALQWISPHFASGTLEWNDATQAALAALGTANGLLVAGIVALALVRRGPTATVVASLAAGAFVLTANSVLLRAEWPAIVTMGAAFAALLAAWDRAPRHEPIFRPGAAAPRVSRAVLSLAAVAISGAALELWIRRSEDEIGRAVPAVVVAIAVIGFAFLGLIRVRREIQRRSTTLSEWTAWMREIRTGDLRDELERYGTEGDLIGDDGVASLPRPLSFPDLTAGDELDIPIGDVPSEEPLDRPEAAPAPVDEPPSVVLPRPAAVRPPTAATSGMGAFSAASRATPAAPLGHFEGWLSDAVSGPRLVVAVEAMSLEDYDMLPREVSAAATAALVEAMTEQTPTPSIVAPVDGPYVLAGFDTADVTAMTSIHRATRALVTQPISTSEGLVGLTGDVAMIRPAGTATLDEIIDIAVTGLVEAKRGDSEAVAR